MRLYYPNARVVLSMVLDGFDVGTESEPYIVAVNPMNLTIVRNPYRQADSWSVEFDASDFPVPPQSIKTGQAELFIYNAGGVEPARRSLADAIVGTEPQVIGLFDRSSILYDESSRTMSIDGQDYTALFLAKGWPANDRIASGHKLSSTVQELIARVDPRGRIALDWQAADDPVIGRGDARRIQRRGYTPQNANNFWEVITEVCGRYGFVVFAENLRIVVTTPRERLTSSDPRLRRLVWGSSLSRMEITRNMGKERTPQIKVVSWDEDAQVIREGIYPKDKIRIVKKAKTGRGKDKGKRVAAQGNTPFGVGTDFDEQQVITVAGLTDPDSLARAAQTIYDLRARGEQEVSIATDDLTDENDLDLIGLRSGDPLQITFDPFNQNEIRVLNEAQRYQYLTDRGFQSRLATAIAQNVDLLIAMRKPYRVRQAEISVDLADEGGFSLSADLQEFVALRQPDQPISRGPLGLGRR